MTDDLSLLNQKQTAALLGISLRQFQRGQSKGIGPVGRVVGKRIYWMRRDITEWWDNSAKSNQTLNPALR